MKPPAPVVAPDPAKPAASATPAEIEITLPVGATYEPAVIESFKAVGKEIGLNSKQAQALLELDAKTASANAAKFAERVQQARAKDIETLKADKEFGGAKYEATVKAADSAIKQFFGEEGSRLLKAAGLDNHPALVKGAARVRAAIAEDTTGHRAPNSGTITTDPKAPATTQTERGAGIYSDPKVVGNRKK